MNGISRIRSTALLALTFAFACGGDDAAGGSGADTDGVVNPMDDPFPGASCETDGGSSGGSCTNDSTTGDPQPQDDCASSEDCGDGGVCAAIPTTDAADEGRLSRGSFACESSCVDDLDEARWCSDDASCCAPNARCTARGYCVTQGSDTTSDGTTTNDGSTSDGSTGGTGDTDTDTDGSTGG